MSVLALVGGDKIAPVPELIAFYSVGDPYGEFSSFAAYPITLRGKRWPTTEHYFQAQKFAGTKQEEVIRCLTKPAHAAAMVGIESFRCAAIGNPSKTA